jgi:hypothetical protein
MNVIAPALVAASSAIILLLGLAHLLFTFYGPKLLPRDRDLQTRMQEVSPVITRQTTMWKAWIGFNASHSYGLILFGAVYGYLALAHGRLLFQSVFLLALGLMMLFGYVFLSKQFFFRFPLRSVLLATLLYLVALVVMAHDSGTPAVVPLRPGLSRRRACRAGADGGRYRSLVDRNRLVFCSLLHVDTPVQSIH